MSKTERETITLFLDDYLEDYLQEQHCLPMRVSIAEIVEKKVKDKLTYHIEWRTDSAIPMIWRYRYWVDSVERYQRSKERSERERVERFIFDANVHKVSRILMREYGMEEVHAKGTAFSVLKSKKMKLKLRALGINKLIESESEL